MTPQGRGTKKKPTKKRNKEPNLIIVTVTDIGKGTRGMDVSVTGNLKLAEAPSLLRLAAPIAEKQLGIE